MLKKDVFSAQEYYKHVGPYASSVLKRCGFFNGINVLMIGVSILIAASKF